MWCALCDAAAGWSRRRFMQVLGQAALATGALPGVARAFTIMDESADVTIGREADPEILKQFGYYENPDLQNYVADVGQRVVGVSDSRFSFQFKVLDHPSVNAMALPGGFVYITRGILALMNDEAQLAGVLGHEATHVNSRHGAKLMTKALGSQLATLVGVGAAAASGGGGSAVSAVAMIANHMSTYMLLGYGRDYETEADEVGLRHARRAGYDPRRTISLFRAMRRTEIMTGQRLYHGFDATHPDTPIRIAKADTMANLLVSEAGGSSMEVKAADYRMHLDGLRYGEAKAQRRIRIYVARPGDTLGSIAKAELQDEGRRFEMATLNDLRDDASVAPGTPLKLVVSSASSYDIRLTPQ
jgi:predicted Zn-dependent protease